MLSLCKGRDPPEHNVSWLWLMVLGDCSSTGIRDGCRPGRVQRSLQSVVRFEFQPGDIGGFTRSWPPLASGWRRMAEAGRPGPRATT